ncbi:hypothetical protein [Streptomyces shenzhenensis]|uniref:hypothetical protein n=1 Tax=Streptomyces shenzhenensis TaxID=943815 RepID=UPI001F1C7804|nr:hypothetical protein [Streptomyces shenzhenensis]
MLRQLGRSSPVGDVVIVKNSPDRTAQPDNGLGGRNLPWRERTAVKCRMTGTF